MGAICHHHGDIFSFYNLLSCVSNKSVQLSRKTSRCQNFTLSIAISICKYTHSLIAALDPTRLGVDKVSLRFNAKKLWGGRGWWMTHEILVSAQGPVGFWFWGLGVWFPGLTIAFLALHMSPCMSVTYLHS